MTSIDRFAPAQLGPVTLPNRILEAATFPPPLNIGCKLFGKRFRPDHPFEEAYFLPYVRHSRDASSMPLVLLRAINRRDTIASLRARRRGPVTCR